MSGHLRFWFTAFLVLAAVSPAPGSCNPFEGVFSIASPEVATAAPAEQECLRHPGRTTTKGQHWVYRYENRNKCWFQVAEGTTIAKKAVHDQARKLPVAASEEKEIAKSAGDSRVDARAEFLRSAPADTPQRPQPVSEFSVAGAVAIAPQGDVVLAPPARDAEALARTAQASPNNLTPPQVDVERLLAAAPAERGEAALSMSPATEATAPFADPGDNGPGWAASWVGALLMTLGLISLLSASRCRGGG